MNPDFEQSFRVSEYLRKRELAILEFERRLLTGEASLSDFRDSIDMHKAEGNVMRTLLRQLGMTVNR